MAAGCGHRLCERIGGACSLAVSKSRGCRPNLTSREIAPEVLDEIRGLISKVSELAAAVRLAQIVRREALDDRNVVALARRDELDFADALAELCVRRR